MYVCMYVCMFVLYLFIHALGSHCFLALCLTEVPYTYGICNGWRDLDMEGLVTNVIFVF